MDLKSLLDRRDLPTKVKAVIAEGCSEIEELKSKLINLEKDLSSARNERSLFLSSSAERIIYHDLDLKVKWLNKVAADSAGKKPSDIIGNVTRSGMGGKNHVRIVLFYWHETQGKFTRQKSEIQKEEKYI